MCVCVCVVYRFAFCVFASMFLHMFVDKGGIWVAVSL